MEAPGRCGIRSIADAPDRGTECLAQRESGVSDALALQDGHTTPSPGQTLSLCPFRVEIFLQLF